MTDYVRWCYEERAHHVRYKRFINSMRHKLVCQECRGDGGWEDTIDYYIGGPWEPCGYCEGTGYVTPHMRGLWLKWKAEEKKRK